VRAKLVEPGYGPSTGFSSNMTVEIEDMIPEAYGSYAQRILGDFEGVEVVTVPADVAEGVYRAATDETGTLRFPAGPDAVALAA